MHSCNDRTTVRRIAHMLREDLGRLPPNGVLSHVVYVGVYFGLADFTQSRKKKSITMVTVAGFASLPVQYGPVAGDKGPVTYMYLRRHAGNDAAHPSGRTLFVVNVPVDATRGTLRDLFRRAGAVESVTIHNVMKSKVVAENEHDVDEAVSDATVSSKKGPPSVVPLPALEPNALLASGSSAHIVFLDESSLERAMELPARYAEKPYRWPYANVREADNEDLRTRRARDTCMTGLQYFLERYRRHRPPHDVIKRHVDSAIARYAWIRQNPQWLLEQRAQGDTTSSLGIGIQAAGIGKNGELVDEDGFTIVQKGNKYGRSGGDEDTGTFAAMTPEFEEQMRIQPDKKKSKELVDFYRFQFREKKRQQFASLRAQFEADKQKIAQRKALFRFKPY